MFFLQFFLIVLANLNHVWSLVSHTPFIQIRSGPWCPILPCIQIRSGPCCPILPCIQIRSAPWCPIHPLFRSDLLLGVPYFLYLDQIWSLVSHTSLYLDQICSLVSHTSFIQIRSGPWCPILHLFLSDLVTGVPYFIYLDQIW